MLEGILQTTRFYKSVFFCVLLLIVSESLTYTAGGLFFLLYSFAFNDWTDAEKDIQGHPERAIPSGKITQTQGLYISLILLIIGVGIFVAFSSEFIIGIASMYVLSTAYSLFFKPYIPVFATILWCTSISILLLQTISQDITDYIAVILLMYSYEIMLDFRDKDTDKLFCKTPTIANLFGKYSLLISFVLFALGLLILIKKLL